jgi:hypothetical protein
MNAIVQDYKEYIEEQIEENIDYCHHYVHLYYNKYHPTYKDSKKMQLVGSKLFANTKKVLMKLYKNKKFISEIEILQIKGFYVDYYNMMKKYDFNIQGKNYFFAFNQSVFYNIYKLFAWGDIENDEEYEFIANLKKYCEGSEKEMNNNLFVIKNFRDEEV